MKQYFGGRVQSAIEATERDGFERGAFIKKKGGKLIFDEMQMGGERNIELQMDRFSMFINGEEIIGTFHTHPNVKHDEELSPKDMGMMMHRDIQFVIIGFKENNMGVMSIFESPEDPDIVASMINGENETIGLKSLENMNKKLRVCNVELWPLN